MPQLSALDLGFLRSPGPGLGNLLFPISRALAGAHRHGGRFIYPTMRQIKFGPYIRREADKRTYGDLLRGRSAREWQDWLAASVSRRIDEAEFDGSQGGAVVRYAGLGRYFHDLTAHSNLIGSWLTANARSAPAGPSFDISVHVRLGDFAAAPSGASAGNVRQSFAWYRRAILKALEITPAVKPSLMLFTDGDAGEVIRQIGAGTMLVDTSPNALTSILQMSKARAVVASRSTFSMWGVFLGGMPAVWDASYEDRLRCLPHRPGLDHLV